MMIDIDHVSFQYSGAEQENLQDFNLQIKKGECVVLTGESGCGKTCVTRLINTLIPHFYEGEMSGAVLIDGVDTRTIQPHDLSDKIGSVFQNPRSQFFSLDTDSEIVFGMENKGMPYQVMLDRYQQTIRELHIEKLKDRNLFDLSGGQKQTIAFASVYALNPDIFVLDEPSSNLDPEAIQELRRLLLLIKAQGKTIVVSEHRLYFLNGIADRIVLMEHGKLKQSWSARDFALLSTEQIKALGLRSYTPARLELPETMPSRNLRKIAMHITNDFVTSAVNVNFHSGISTWCYFDEFHILLRDALTASYFVAVWKMLRKKGCVPSALTQNVKDLLASREIEAILDNTDFMILLAQAQSDRAILAKQLGISEHQLSYITHSNAGEGLLFYGDVTIPFVDRFPKGEIYNLLTTRPEDLKHEAGNE